MKIIIYKIQHLTKPELIYIGSTQNFEVRAYQHKIKSSEENPKQKLYKCIQENDGWNNFTCVSIDEFETDSRQAGRIRENHKMIELKATLNNNRAFITKQEAKQSVKDYYLKHRDELILKKKSKIKCSCGCLLSRSNPYTHKTTKKHLKLLNETNETNELNELNETNEQNETENTNLV
jgi:hypothetical protein